MQKLNFKKSFTLVELMIVIAVLAILTALVVFVLNPSKLIMQFHDSRRTADITNLYKSIQAVVTFDTSGILNKGDISKVYLSLPDSSSTCSTYTDLPVLSSGLVYSCVSSVSYRLSDGTGWMPVNLQTGNINNGSALPIDPVNNGSYFLSYYTNGYDFALKANMQTSTNKVAINDGDGISSTFVLKTNKVNVPLPNEEMYPIVDSDNNVFFIDRFEASNNGSNIPQSKAFQTPWTYGNTGGNVTLALAKQKCQQAGKKLITTSEWGALAIKSKADNTIPSGNNYTTCNGTCGTAGLDFLGDRDVDLAGSQTCIQDTAVYNWNCGGCIGNPRCQTGSGTGTGFDVDNNISAWTHNKKNDGVWDLNGNVWEWNDFGGEYGYITNGLWWNKDWDHDGQIDSTDEVYVIMPANGHMCNSLTTNQLDGLIADDNDINRCQGGSAAWITNVSGVEPYTVTVSNMIGDIDQFRDGDGTNYGTGNYYFSTSPIYVGTGSENTATLYECTAFDYLTKTFSNCSKYSTLGTYGDNRAPTVNDIMVSIINRSDKFGNTGDYYFGGYFQTLRTETALSKMALPSSLYSSSNYNSDYFYIRAFGARGALRGGRWISSSSAGLFLWSLNDTPSYSDWDFGFRCSSN